MTNQITEFRGEYFFLSNFYNAPLSVDGIWYKNSEAAFQAAKLDDLLLRTNFGDLDPSKAKSLGRRVTLRPDWESVKDEEMKKVLYAKFTQNPKLAERLLATGTKLLIEENDWGDTYWGVCDGGGFNKLGVFLMELRSELQATR